LFVLFAILAEQIIGIRSDIVEEWKERMRRVPQDHGDGIRKVCLSELMQRMLEINRSPFPHVTET
jgi:hypothetical protein